MLKEVIIIGRVRIRVMFLHSPVFIINRVTVLGEVTFSGNSQYTLMFTRIEY